MDLDEKVAAAKKRIAVQQQAKAKADNACTLAEERRAADVKQLREEFDIGPEEIPAALSKLGADLEAEVRRVEALLDRSAGGPG